MGSTSRKAEMMTETRKDHANGWACVDCLMLMANGETPPGMDEDETAAYLELVGDSDVTLGRLIGEDGCECDDWDTGQHRDGCERVEFSMARCDVCRRPNNAGGREAVTFWLEG